MNTEKTKQLIGQVIDRLKTHDEFCDVCIENLGHCITDEELDRIADCCEEKACQVCSASEDAASDAPNAAELVTESPEKPENPATILMIVQIILEIVKLFKKDK